MKYLHFCIFILALQACTRDYFKERVVLMERTKKGIRYCRYTIRVPKSAVDDSHGSTHGKTLLFWEKDSSLIYISDDEGFGSYNSENVRKGRKFSRESVNQQTGEKYIYSGKDS